MILVANKWPVNVSGWYIKVFIVEYLSPIEISSLSEDFYNFRLQYSTIWKENNQLKINVSYNTQKSILK